MSLANTSGMLCPDRNPERPPPEVVAEILPMVREQEHHEQDSVPSEAGLEVPGQGIGSISCLTRASRSCSVGWWSTELAGD